MLRISCLFLLSVISCFPLLSQVDLQNSSLPIVVIETFGDSILDNPRIIAHMGIISNDQGVRNNIHDPFSMYDGQISIEIRGSSSQFFPKKSYGLETQLPDGSNNNVSLFGMPEENDWILYGPYSDKTLMRNRLTFELGSKLSVYSPRTAFCELLINGEYRGIYVWMEKIKRDANRLDIGTLDPDDTDPDKITGGYIIKLDKTTGSGGQGWETPTGTYVQYDYPAADEINSAQRTYIQNYVNEFENALYGYQFRDPVLGYPAYADVLSFVDFILMNELTKNVDGYRLSTFLHKSRNGKLTAGPLWDFNLAFGNAGYCGGETINDWALNFNRLCPEDFWTINQWWDRMLSDPAFTAFLINRWETLRKGPWHPDSINAQIDRFLVELDDAPVRNFEQWKILGEWVWPNPVILGTYNPEVEYLRTWIRDRAAWIDANIHRISYDVRAPIGSAKYFVVPNPFSDYLDINMNTDLNGTVEFQLFNLHGEQVLEIPIEVEAGFELRYTWEGEGAEGKRLPSGLYLYRMLLNGELKKEGKLVRQ